MINKQNLWFITLFSLVLILGVYYLTLGDEANQVFSLKSEEAQASMQINESDSLLALRIAEDENVLAQIEEYQNTILDVSKSLDEKNTAYENLQVLSKQKSKSDDIEKLIKEKFSLPSFIKFDKDQINITIAKKDHSVELANSIIRTVQSLYNEQMYITVKFE